MPTFFLDTSVFCLVTLAAASLTDRSAVGVETDTSKQAQRILAELQEDSRTNIVASPKITLFSGGAQLESGLVADVIAVLGSMNLIAGELDR